MSTFCLNIFFREGCGFLDLQKVKLVGKWTLSHSNFLFLGKIKLKYKKVENFDSEVVLWCVPQAWCFMFILFYGQSREPDYTSYETSCIPCLLNCCDTSQESLALAHLHVQPPEEENKGARHPNYSSWEVTQWHSKSIIFPFTWEQKMFSGLLQFSMEIAYRLTKTIS